MPNTVICNNIYQIGSFLILRPANGRIIRCITGAAIAGLSINGSLLPLGCLLIANYCLYSRALFLMMYLIVKLIKLNDQPTHSSGKIKIESAIKVGIAEYN